MSDRDAVFKVAVFGAGVTVGIVLALLFAPKSGKETRRLIAKQAEAGKDYLRARGKELAEQAEEMVEKGKGLVAKQTDRLADALETGKQAARDVLVR